MNNLRSARRIGTAIGLLAVGLMLPALADRPLGEADRFVILAADQAFAYGPTVVNGNVGGRNQIFGPFTINGSQESGASLDPVIAQVIEARAEAAALPGERLRSNFLSNVNVGAGQGVFPPGVYTFHGKGVIRPSGITLQGTGNPNDTWVFNFTDNPNTAPPRIEGSLVIQDGAEVRLAGGLNTVANVYWNVSGPVAAGRNVRFRGTVMAGQSPVIGNVTFGPNCEVVGKLISVNGDVSTEAGTVVHDSIIGNPPSVTLQPAQTAYTVNPGQAIQFSISATDPDQGDLVTLSVENAPPGALLSPSLPRTGNPANTTFTWTPTAGDTGARTVTFTAVDSNGLISSRSVSFNTTLDLPNPPTGLAAQVISRTEIRLAWNSGNPEALPHRVERSVNGGPFAAVGGAVPAGTYSYSDLSVGANGHYTYRVRAENASGVSEPSNTATGITLPMAPINFTLDPVASTQINLYWQDPNAFPAQVLVERSLDAGGTWSQLKQVPAGLNTTSDTGLTPNRTYFYRLKATNDVGNSESTAPQGVSTTGGGCIELTSPNLGAVWRIGTTAEITWNSQEPHSFVKIEISTDGGRRWRPLAARVKDTGSYRRKINGPPTSTARIRITSLTDKTCQDESTGNFSIAYGGRLEAPSELDFGTAVTPKAVSKSITLRNTSSTESLQVSISKAAAPFRTPRLKTIVLQPGRSRVIRVTFQPRSAGSYSTQLNLASSDPTRPSHSITLKGTGEARTPKPRGRRR